MSGKASVLNYQEADGSHTKYYGIDAFAQVLERGTFAGRLRYNELTGRAEINRSDDPDVQDWDSFGDSDLSRLRYYFDSEYGFNNRKDLDDALNVVFSYHSIDPVREYLRSLQWDGVNRITNFLTEIMHADNDAYTAECSRLIFAGGVHRALNPGCKFDSMIVLVGGQGCGKSTIVRLLNGCDEWYKEVTTIDGKEGIEALSGAWISEFSEMMAMTSIKEIEGVKAYITRQVDHVRKAYGRYESDLKRRCVFVGTTNNDRFLTDKTGNRRFYPVVVHSDGYDIGNREREIRMYINQCWAEAVALYDQGMLPPYPSKTLSKEFAERQEDATEDDWRVGAVRQYLDRKKPGDYVCVWEIYDMVISERPGEKPPRKDSIDIGKIMASFSDWQKVGLYTFDQAGFEYGRQKAYRKKGGAVQLDSTQVPDDMPF